MASGAPIVTQVGNLVREPEIKFTASGHTFASFTVATTPRKKQGDEWVDGDPIFLRATAWRQLAENIAESNLQKGCKVIITGTLKQNEWTNKEGVKVTSTEIDVESFGVELSRATVAVSKVSGNGAAPRAQHTPARDTDIPF